MKKLFCIVFVVSRVFIHMYAQKNDLLSSLKTHVEILASDSFAGRGLGFPEKIFATEYIINCFRDAGLKPLGKDYVHSFFNRIGVAMIEGKNIAGIIEGSDPLLKNEYIIIGAHYDHLGWVERNNTRVIYNGADDNASGIAVLIEAAKILNSAGNVFKRSIVFVAFDGEEAGLLGSTEFIRHIYPEYPGIKFMISLDMTGMYSKNKGVILTGTNSLNTPSDIFAKAASETGTIITRKKNYIEYRTDTWPFAGYGIPAIHITTGENSPYHKPEDDSHLLDYEGMSKITLFTAAVISDLSESKAIKENTGFIRRSYSPMLMTGFTLFYGSGYHTYKSEFYKGKSVLSFGAGLTAQMRISQLFCLQSGIYYLSSGSHVEQGVLRTHSVFPETALVLTTPGENLAKPLAFFHTGVYYSYHFAGRTGGSPADFTSLWDRNDFGVRLGGGFQIMKSQICYYYTFGLKPVNINSPENKIFNRTACISMTKFF